MLFINSYLYKQAIPSLINKVNFATKLQHTNTSLILNAFQRYVLKQNDLFGDLPDTEGFMQQNIGGIGFPV